MSTESKAINGWPALWLWSLALGSVALSAVSVMTIGMFIAPFALLLCALAGFRANAWPPFLLAILVGPGLVALLIGFLHLDYVPCPPGPLTAGPGEHFKCGGFDPTPWLTTGAGLVALGLSAYALYRRHAGNSIRDAHSPGAV